MRTLLWIGLATLGTVFGGVGYASDSGSMSQSCSGQVRHCDGSICTQKSFLLYAYQYAFIANGNIQSETHTFTASGALGASSDYDGPARLSGNFLVYEGTDFEIAVPWQAQFGMFARQIRGSDQLSQWQRLCPNAANPAGPTPTVPGPAAPGGGGANLPTDGSGAISKTCSAKVRVCDDGICLDKPFYAYTYQYANVIDGELVSESHSLSLTGELGDADDYTLLGATAGYALYSGPRFELSVPYMANRPLQIRQKNSASSGWQSPCP